MDIKINWSSILDGLDNWNKDVDEKLLKYAIKKGLEMEAYAKMNRPWTDQTGEARRTLKGEATKTSTGARIELSGGKEYSPYLEYKNDGKYAILHPTVNQFAPKIFEDFEV